MNDISMFATAKEMHIQFNLGCKQAGSSYGRLTFRGNWPIAGLVRVQIRHQIIVPIAAEEFLMELYI